MKSRWESRSELFNEKRRWHLFGWCDYDNKRWTDTIHTSVVIRHVVMNVDELAQEKGRLVEVGNFNRVFHKWEQVADRLRIRSEGSSPMISGAFQSLPSSADVVIVNIHTRSDTTGWTDYEGLHVSICTTKQDQQPRAAGSKGTGPCGMTIAGFPVTIDFVLVTGWLWGARHLGFSTQSAGFVILPYVTHWYRTY